MKLPFVDFYGLKISVFSKEELENAIIHTIDNAHSSEIYYGYSLAVFSYLRKYSSYYEITRQFDVMVTDGRLFYILVKSMGVKLKFDISIPRLTLMTIDIAAKHNFKVMLVGGTLESNAKAITNLKLAYPMLDRLSGLDGYFEVEDEKTVIDIIVRTGPQVLLLGLPTPQKQIFAAKIRPMLDGCVIIPCGGMIEVLAGNERLTPLWLKKIGLASIYRHLQHPQRIPELLTVMLLTIKVFSVILYRKYRYANDHFTVVEVLRRHENGS